MAFTRKLLASKVFAALRLAGLCWGWGSFWMLLGATGWATGSLSVCLVWGSAALEPVDMLTACLVSLRKRVLGGTVCSFAA